MQTTMPSPAPGDLGLPACGINRGLVAGRIAIDIGAWIVTLACAAALLAAISLFTVPKILGWQGVIVLSGSMEPGLKTGGLVFIDQSIDATKLRPGDVITFEWPQQPAVHVTHRVIDSGTDDQGLWYMTKGDANNDADPGLVRPGAVIGKAKFDVDRLGRAALWLRHRNNLYLLLWGPAAIIIGGELMNIFGELRNGKKKVAS